jgi:DNA-binding PadR family transcriptional regulator
MTSLLKFGPKRGRERSFLAIYILHSLDRRPKSGYELLQEIKEKTAGLWEPSKGTLYPILRQLEEESLIEVSETGIHGKKIFSVSGTGKKALDRIKEHGKEHHRKMALYKNLIIDIFGGSRLNAHGLLFDIHESIDALPPGCEDEAARVLERCLSDLISIGMKEKPGNDVTGPEKH